MLPLAGGRLYGPLYGTTESMKGAVTANGIDYLGGRLNVKGPACGATGNGRADDTAAINRCEAYAEAHRLAVFWPAGHYKVTSSINCGFTSPTEGGLWNVGDSRGRLNDGVVIYDELKKPGAVFDCGGDTQGGIENMVITTPTNRYSGTASTAAILVSEGATGNIEGGQFFTIRNVLISATGDCAGCAAIAMPGVDEFLVSMVYANGGGVVTGAGLGLSTAVTSQLYSLSADLPNTNPTRGLITHSDFISHYTPAYQDTGTADYELVDDYGTLGPGSTVGATHGIVEITNGFPRGVPTNNLDIFGLRLEDHSGQPGVIGIMFGSKSSGIITGVFGLSGTGSDYLFGTEGDAVNGNFVDHLTTHLQAHAAYFANVGPGWTFAQDNFDLGDTAPPNFTPGNISSGSRWADDIFSLPSSAVLTSSQFLAALPPSAANVTVNRGSISVTTGGGRERPTVVSALPHCGPGREGALYLVRDARSPAYLGRVKGGGSTITPVLCNGRDWVSY